MQEAGAGQRPKRRWRLIVTAIVAAALLVTAAAPAAFAGTYQVKPCGVDGRAGTADGLRALDTDIMDRISIDFRCSGVASQYVQMGHNGPGSMSHGAVSLWFAAAADTRFARVAYRLFMSPTLTGDYYWNVASYERNAAHQPSGVESIELWGVSNGRFAFGCDANRGTPGVGCELDKTGGATMREFDFTVDDSYSPTYGSIRGSLLGAGRRSGLQTLEFTAEDRGSGIYRAELIADGRVVETINPSAGGRCAKPFQYMKPCDLSVSDSFTADTAYWADGQHAVRLRLYDATETNITNTPTFTVDTSNAPVNRNPPTLIGPASPTDLRAGTSLNSTSGSWDGPVLFSEYRWLRCDASGGPASCVVIPGSTGPQYVLTGHDAYHTIRLQIRATRGINASDWISSAASAPVRDGNGLTSPAPHNAVPPTWQPGINVVDPQPGDALIVDRGEWLGSIDSFAYVFKRCPTTGACAVVQEGSSGRYALVHGDVGHRILAEVRARNAHGEVSASTPTTGLVMPEDRRGNDDDQPKPPQDDPPRDDPPRDDPPRQDPPDSRKPDSPVPPVVPPGDRDRDRRRIQAVPNGQCHGGQARLVARFGRRSARAVVRYGKRARLGFELTCVRTGKPIRGAELIVSSSRRPKSRPSTTRTNEHGHATVLLSGGHSRTIAVGWRPDSLASRYAAQTKAKLLVRSRLTFNVGPRKVRSRQVIRMTGVVAGAPKGVMLNVQAKDGKRWRTFDQVVTDRRGSFAYSYRFRRSAPGSKFTFRVQLPGAQKRLGTLPGKSRAIGVRLV